MGTILKGGVVVEFEPASVEPADLKIENGRITARAPELAPQPGDDVVHVDGKLLAPGLVCAHHHLYSALARGMPPPATKPENFPEILEKIWWRLDRALDLDAVQVSAQVGALDALCAGTTTVFDHHASPNAIAGSLMRVARGVNEVGLRGVLCYEVTDRNGPEGREAGLAENVEFAKKAQGRFRGMVGAHAAFTLSNETLQGLKRAVEAAGVGMHIHLAEDPADERLSVQKYGAAPVARLMEAGLLTPKTVVAHAVHLAWPELSQVITSGAWIIHNPRSNMNNQVGYAPAGKFGARAALGTDGIGADMVGEAQLAHFRALDAGQPIDALHYLSNGHRLASEAFGVPIGPLREGAAADIVVLEYRSPTPLTAANLAWHLLFGWGTRHVESVMVEGVWRLWGRRPLSTNPRALADQARQVAEALWARMAQFS